MNQLDSYQLSQLTGQVECNIHTHPKNTLNHNDVVQLADVCRIKPVTTATYTLLPTDTYVSVAQTCSVTLPAAADGKEYFVILTSAGTLTLLPHGSDTILGAASLATSTVWACLHLKAAENGNWVRI